MPGLRGIAVIATLMWGAGLGSAWAQGLLDGRVFEGRIGPVESPDLEDSLHFGEGHFWSDICTRCGFHPGPYSAEQTAEGIVFRGRLQSDSRGQFDYEGLVHPDGRIEVAIRWQRKRWYWTARRDIAFEGVAQAQSPVALDRVRQSLTGPEIGTHPLCARF